MTVSDPIFSDDRVCVSHHVIQCYETSLVLAPRSVSGTQVVSSGAFDSFGVRWVALMTFFAGLLFVSCSPVIGAMNSAEGDSSFSCGSLAMAFAVGLWMFAKFGPKAHTLVLTVDGAPTPIVTSRDRQWVESVRAAVWQVAGAPR